MARRIFDIVCAIGTFALVCGLFMLADANGAEAQSTNYYGSDGSYLGQSYTSPNGVTNYYNGDGTYGGQSSINRGGTTNYYNGLGEYRGQSQTYPRSR